MKGFRDARHDFRGKLVVLALNRLGHLPPAENLTALLGEAGIPLVVVTFGRDAEEEIFGVGSYARIRIPCGWQRLLPAKLRAAAAWIHALGFLLLHMGRTGRPDMLVTNGLATQAMALVLTLLFRIRFIAHVHEVEDGRGLSPLNRLFYRLEGSALRRAAFTIFPGTERRDIYTARYALPVSPQVVFNCPRLRERRDPASMRRKLDLPEDRMLLLYIGGVGPGHGILETIGAMPELPSLGFVIVGWCEPAFQMSLETAARERGVADRVWLREATREKWDYLDACDLGLVIYEPVTLRTTYNVTASNKLMESLAAGQAVLLRHSDDSPAFVARYPVAEQVERVDAAEIAAGLARMTGDPVRLARLRHAAVAAHRDTLNFEAQARDVIERIKRELTSAS